MLVYTLIGFLRPAVYIFLLPLYLNVFTEAEYGLYDLMNIVGHIIMVVVALRLNAAMLTQYYDYQGDDHKKKRFLRSLFSFSLFISIGFVALSYFFGEAIFGFVFKSEEAKFFPFGFTILVYAALSEINACYYIYLKNEKSLSKYALVIISQIVLAIILQFIFIIPLNGGVQGALMGMLLANVMTTTGILFMEKGIITFSPDMSMIRPALKFSLNLIPYLLIYWVLSKGGKIFLERYADLSTVGLFALLMTLTTVIILLVEAVVSGIRPFLFETFARNKLSEDEEKISLFIKMIINVPLLTIPLIVLVGNNIGLITSKQNYLEVGQYISLASLMVFLLAYGKLFYQQLIFVKKSDIVTRLSFLVLITIVTGFYFLVPEYKIWGVLISTLIANLLMAILFYYAAQKRFYVRYNFKDILLLPILIFVLLFLIEWICIYQLGLSRPQFGVIQFLILSLIILAMNYKTLAQYKVLFFRKA